MNTQSRGAILHVEDDLKLRGALGMLLRTGNYELSGAASAAEALALVERGLCPDVLIVDFTLEGELNGAEATELLCNALGYAPPIILLTGDPSNAEAPWITDAPVWLARKPFDGRVLLAAMPPLVQLSRALREAMRPAARLAAARGRWS